MGTEHIPVRRSGDDAATVPKRRSSRDASATSPATLPDRLRTGIESLSGYSMDEVTVHYRSPEPRNMGALAFATGSSIHVAPGEERHLPHEAWHVVQQAQGRVRPNTTMMRRPAIDDTAELEREADAMGARAGRIRRAPPAGPLRPLPDTTRGRVIQRMKSPGGVDLKTAAELNDMLRQVGSKARIDTSDFDDEPTAKQLDAAIGASTLKVGKTTSQKALLGALTTQLALLANVKPKTPDELRREAAKECPTYAGEYFGGKANELHVHVYGYSFHLKGPGGKRYDIFQDGVVNRDQLIDARDALRGHGMGGTLNAAIDKGFIYYGAQLDKY